MSSSRPIIRCSVPYEGDSLTVCGTLNDQDAFTFWIERSNGRRWLDISQPAHAMAGIDTRREIAVACFDDDHLARIAMSTGWFARTGKTVQHPINETNEVWAVSLTCRKMFAEVGVRIEVPPAKPAAAAQAADLPQATLYDLLSDWMEKLRDAHVTALVVTVPNPFSEVADARFLVASYPQSLRVNAAQFESGEPMPPSKPLAEWHYLENLNSPRWARFMRELGYKSVIALRVPVASEQFIECLMFGTGQILDTHQAAFLTWTALTMLPQIKLAASGVVCSLTPRERVCLLSAFQGKTANETAEDLDCATRTVRLHLSNAMGKLGTGSTISAIQRAQMLGII